MKNEAIYLDGKLSKNIDNEFVTYQNAKEDVDLNDKSLKANLVTVKAREGIVFEE
jgi:hypothetical protein